MMRKLSQSLRAAGRRFHLGLLIAACVCPAEAEQADYYVIEDVPMPEGVDPQIGGIDFAPDGTLYVCFHQGEVMARDPETGAWRKFADGLQEPLGVVALDKDSVMIMQRPELTRIADTDGDGVADLYGAFYDEFGMTGNYHEFAFGPARDKEGNFYISLNTASNGASIRPEVRGEFIDIGLPREEFYRPWGEVKGRAGRMYSRVPFRGCVVKISPEGEGTLFATGFRSPNGLGLDLDGNLYVTDNQGDWIGTSKCFHVREGGFYGHPASLVWRGDWDGRDPLDVPVPELEELRHKAAFLFPHGSYANSPTQPLVDSTGGAFGPFAGQMLVGEMNNARILRLAPDRVAGVMQGAVIPFLEGGNLGKGNNRLAFSPDKELFIGKTHLSWAGGDGLKRVKWTGETPMAVHTVKMTEKGFDIRFTLPVDVESATAPEAVSAETYTYNYHVGYGSPEVDKRRLAINAAQVLPDGRTLRLEVDALKPGYVHDFQLRGVKSKGGVDLLHPRFAYTAIVLTDGTREYTPPPPPPPEPMRLTESGQVFEAEEARVVGGQRAGQHAGHTGRGYIDYAAPTGDSVTWNIEAPRAGEYTLVFRYAVEGSRPLRLDVNGEAVADRLGFTGGSWTEWITTSREVSLKRGENVISITAVGASGPNVDHLRVEF